MIYHVEMLRIRGFCLNNTSVLCFVCSVGDGVEMLGEGICRKGWKQVNPGMTSILVSHPEWEILIRGSCSDGAPGPIVEARYSVLGRFLCPFNSVEPRQHILQP